VAAVDVRGFHHVLCGATHLMGAVVLWLPLYGLDALIKAFTALISVITAVMLWPLIPRALKLPSPDQLRRVNEVLQSEIDERKRMEEALRLAKEMVELSLQKERILMAAIVESTENAIIGETLDGTITHWNRAAEKIFGYPAEEIIGQSVFALIPHYEYRDDFQKIDHAIQRGEVIKIFETVRVRKDGSFITISVTVSPICDQEGRIVGISKIIRDISEKKQAEETLRKSQAQLKSFIQCAPSSIAMFDLDMNYMATSGS